MKAFLDYVCDLTVKEPFKLKQYNDLIKIFIGDKYIDSIWKNQNYVMRRIIPIKYKLIGEYRSFFSHPIICGELLRYRFL